MAPTDEAAYIEMLSRLFHMLEQIAVVTNLGSIDGHKGLQGSVYEYKQY